MTGVQTCALPISVTDSDSSLHGILAPDGSHYTEGKDIINFYTGGWSPQNVQKILAGIKYYLDEKKIKYGPFAKDMSKMFSNVPVIRIPIISWKPTENIPPAVNLSNFNANLIFGDILKYPEKDGGYLDINPRDLIIKIDNLLSSKLQILTLFEFRYFILHFLFSNSSFNILKMFSCSGN